MKWSSSTLLRKLFPKYHTKHFIFFLIVFSSFLHFKINGNLEWVNDVSVDDGDDSCSITQKFVMHKQKVYRKVSNTSEKCFTRTSNLIFLRFILKCKFYMPQFQLHKQQHWVVKILCLIIIICIAYRTKLFCIIMFHFQDYYEWQINIATI